MDYCAELERETANSTFSLYLSLAVTLGTVVSYIPQHQRIISLKSSAGLSPWYMLLGGISSFSTVTNSLILHAPVFSCGLKISFKSFFLGIIGFIQVTSQWMCFFLIAILFILFFPEEAKMEADGMAWRRAKRCAAALAGYMAAALLLAVILLISHTERAMVFAKLLGILAVVMSVTQFVPQIWRTLHFQQVGALSIPTMCIQTPGSFFFCLAISLSPKSDWSTWLPYFVSGCLQGILLILCIRFRNHPSPTLLTGDAISASAAAGVEETTV